MYVDIFFYSAAAAALTENLYEKKSLCFTSGSWNKAEEK
jgi:hypothetical protein